LEAFKQFGPFIYSLKGLLNIKDEWFFLDYYMKRGDLI